MRRSIRTALVASSFVALFSLACNFPGSGGDDNENSKNTVSAAERRDVAQVVQSISSVMASSSQSRARPSRDTRATWPQCPDSVNGCSVACDGGLMTISCDGTVDQHYTCDSTTYSIEHSLATVIVDITNLSESWQGTMTYSVDFSADISGGSIGAPTPLECRFSASLPLEGITTSSSTEPAIDCSDFHCSLGGRPLTCDELKQSLQDDPCDDMSGGEGPAQNSGNATPVEGFSITGSCDARAGGFCYDYIGADMAEGMCVGTNTYSKLPCANGSLIGSCRVSRGQPGEYIWRFYSPMMTLETAQGLCARANGLWML